MTSENSNTPSSDAKGFGGFDDLVSDVSKDIESATKSTPPSNATAKLTSNPRHATSQADAHPVNKSPVQHHIPKDKFGAKWIWGVGFFIFVLIIIGNSGKKDGSSYSPPPIYSPPSTYVPAAAQVHTPTAPATSDYSPVSPNEDKPPVSNNFSLSRDQIRYCLSEDIRLGSMKGALNHYADNEVDLFNAKIHDYNSRCSKFRYRRGSLESVRSEVEANRLMLEAEGHARLVNIRGEPIQEKTTKAKPSRPNSDAQLRKYVEDQSTTTDSGSGIVINQYRENYKTCISGDYPFLCKHALLTSNEAIQVETAEKRANYKTCISGDYPFLCKHALLTSNEAIQVETAEKRAKTRQGYP
jgi:hypothetical protein